MSQEGTEETSTIADLMKMMIEDRKKREEEIANERERHDREVEARVQEMARQMEVMRSLVKESQKEPEESVARVGSEQAVKLTKLTESDDVEAYLTTFERMMEAYRRYGEVGVPPGSTVDRQGAAGLCSNGHARGRGV